MRGPSVSSDRRFMYFISQLGESDCGFTCLKMILAHLHKDRNYLYLPGEANKEYSFKDLQDIAEKYHVEAHGVRPANLQEVAKAKKSWPLLTNIKLKKGQRHSVIIKKVTKNKVHYFDPALGHKAVPIEVTSFLLKSSQGQNVLISFHLISLSKTKYCFRYCKL